MQLRNFIAAATVAVLACTSMVATSGEAEARRRGGAIIGGVIGGLALGALLGGSAYAYGPRYYHSPGYYSGPRYYGYSSHYPRYRYRTHNYRPAYYYHRPAYYHGGW